MPQFIDKQFDRDKGNNIAKLENATYIHWRKVG